MSGHSHAKTIKHVKEAADKKRGQLFSKFSRVISIAAKNGGDPELNASLRMVIEQAKKINMPNDNIERAIKRGTGELAGEVLEEFSFEAYGPAKSALIITGITGNKNRTLNEIKNLLAQNNAKMGEEGSVKWQFEKKGIIIINPGQNKKEDLEMSAIESGAQDLRWENSLLEIYVKPDNLEQTKKMLESKNLTIESASLGWAAKEKIEISPVEKDKIEKLFAALDNNDDVQEVYSNIKL